MNVLDLFALTAYGFCGHPFIDTVDAVRQVDAGRASLAHAAGQAWHDGRTTVTDILNAL